VSEVSAVTLAGQRSWFWKSLVESNKVNLTKPLIGQQLRESGVRRALFALSFKIIFCTFSANAYILPERFA
jgi:hypothetical protein